jgi:membrane-associated phospholipid phosphatase
MDQFRRSPMPNPRVAGGLSLMNVAIYDAMVAAWNAKYDYNRPRPSVAGPTLTPHVAVPNSPSYPSEHAAAAGAAATILGYLYPDAAQDFAAKADAAAQSRVLAGVQYPSDVQVGLDLGREVAQQVIARAQTDGSDAMWDGTMPSGPGHWTGDKPVEPLAGTWQPWVLASGDAPRPPPPPAYDSSQMAAELQEVQTFTRTWQTNQKALYWQIFDTVFPLWYDYAGPYIFENHQDANPPRTAAIYAAMSVAQYGAIIACWDAKYPYWSIRPFQLDPTLVTLFPTPSHPSYPSSHACDSSGITGALAGFFPANATFLNGKVDELGESPIWAGLHFRSDIDAGLALGRVVAQQVVERVQTMTDK